MGDVWARVVGGRVHPPQFMVPAGRSVHFYVADGQLISNTDGWAILDGLRGGMVWNAGNVPSGYLQTRTGGQMCDDYYGVPYVTLGVVNGVWLEGGVGVFRQILEGLTSQTWGSPETNTVQTQMVVLPSILGGPAYARSVIQLSNVANCPGVTDVHWISCREVW